MLYGMSDLKQRLYFYCIYSCVFYINPPRQHTLPPVLKQKLQLPLKPASLRLWGGRALGRAYSEDAGTQVMERIFLFSSFGW